MNSILTYGILCEDAAHKNFITRYLQQQYPDQFLESAEFGWRTRASNAKEVGDSLVDAVRLGFTRFQLDVLFVGRDSDATDDKRIQSLIDSLHLKCGYHRPKVVLVVPVQCIEHWLLYLQKHRDNPVSTKNETLELIRRTEAKEMVYGPRKRDPDLIKSNEILDHLDSAWLEQYSKSFNHFHQQVVDFLKQY